LLVLVSTRVIGGNDSKKKQARRLTGAPDFLYPAQWVRQLKPLHRIVGPLVEVYTDVANMVLSGTRPV